ncbi:transglycosylase SLT domain-containing protein [Streptomyces bacillaris]|uniref:transglycosylase SLT domain-containing protein n=1 Tax=Streptomyces TaxID=1883 RepID=UPI00083071BE|nr:transglycosylase SLT domain-containing protein [Streptomyces sp. NBRC 109706]
MTVSTNGTRRAMTRSAVMAGIVTVGATALTLPFATTAMAAEATGQSIPPAADQTTAPTAFTPHGPGGLLGKAITTAEDEEPDEPGTTADAEEPEESEEAEDSEKSEETTAADTEEAADEEATEEAEEEEPGTEGFDADEGRGERYNADGSIVVIPQHQQPKPVPASAEELDGWIREALDVMAEKGIPGSYDGIYRNMIRESSGDPLTINLWDTNAEKNIPSKGLLQVIDPTFEQYHVEGTSENIYDPVANIVAACNYAAARYGSMDNVNSAY